MDRMVVDEAGAEGLRSYQGKDKETGRLCESVEKI